MSDQPGDTLRLLAVDKLVDHALRRKHDCIIIGNSKGGPVAHLFIDVAEALSRAGFMICGIEMVQPGLATLRIKQRKLLELKEL